MQVRGEPRTQSFGAQAPAAIKEGWFAKLGEGVPNSTMQRLLTHRADDGSHLILGVQEASAEHPPRLMFQHEGHGEPELLPDGPLQVRYVTIGGSRRIVIFGDDNDEPRAEWVVLRTPYAVGTPNPLLKARAYHRRIWMSTPEPFRPGEEFKPGPVAAQWVGDSTPPGFPNFGEILHEEETPWLEWGTPWPTADVVSRVSKPRPKPNNESMERLIVQDVEDGSHLILGLDWVYEEHPLSEELRLELEREGIEAPPEIGGSWGPRLVFQHEGPGEPELLPQRGAVWVRYVMVGGERHVVFGGDDLDNPIDRVVLDTRHAVGTVCPLVKNDHWHAVWMHAEPFKPGPVTFSLMTRGSDEIRYREQIPPLEWGAAWPTEENMLAFLYGKAGSLNRLT